MIRLTRRYRFSSSHRLHSPRLTEEANRKLYGKCNNPYGHGHDYILEVSARGPVDPESGLLLNVERLDRLVEDSVLAELRFRNLNDLEAFSGERVPTTENLVAEIEGRLRQRWPAAFGGPWPALDHIRIQETPRNVFESAARER